jgi:hypothetical protein
METIQASSDPIRRENRRGEVRKAALKTSFYRRLRLEFHGARLTNDGGLLACRVLDVSARFFAVFLVARHFEPAGRFLKFR